MLSYIIKLLKALGANSKPSQIANSFCIGFILGVMPKNNLLWWLVFVFFMFVRINKAGYFIMMLLGAFISPYLDPTFHKIGEFVLTYEPLVPVYSKLLEIPFVGFTRFNNTIVCGSLVAGIIAYIPLYIFMLVFIWVWRKWIAPFFNRSKVVKMFFQLPLVRKLTSKLAEIN
ncbi:MAG: TIGR03546 family protein [Spirochaetaceae bacterium]|nr:TIGR03546 family protein [Spirochaetaceae bacterium]